MNRPTILTAALLLTTICSPLGKAEEPLAKQEAKKVYWQLYVAELPKELYCYFTIERMPNMPGEKKYRCPFIRNDVTLDRNVKTVKSLVDKLRKEMEGIAVIQNAKNPAVIHLVDERLLKIDGYVMDKKVDIIYSGVIERLSQELEKRIPEIGPMRGGSLRDMFGDYVTQVKIDVKNQTVREVLTDCVPLEKYSRLLWRAKTRKMDGQYKTIVQYYGPRCLPKTTEK